MKFVGICLWFLVLCSWKLKSRTCLLDLLKSQNLILKGSVCGNVFERAFWHRVVSRSSVVNCLNLFFNFIWNLIPFARISFQLFCITMWDTAFLKNVGGINILVCIRVDWWDYCVALFLISLWSCLLKKKEKNNCCL